MICRRAWNAPVKPSATSGGAFDPEAKRKRLDELNRRMAEPGFWGDSQGAGRLTAEATRLTGELDRAERLKHELADLEELGGMARDEGDAGELASVAEELDKLADRALALTAQALLSGPYDDQDAIVELHPGAGGTESADWAEMLLRMYTRYFQLKGWKAELLEITAGDEAGIKSATLAVRGDLVFGHLRGEIGVHRLVRLSPYDANHRRHTSFAALYAYPDLDTDVEVEINPDDLRVDVFRSSGHGGQSVNTTDSAVRITHLLTGITVSCQNERSQKYNKESAMRVLRARLADHYRRERELEIADSKADKRDIAWGSQIRNYVLHPYRLVKDPRTGEETSNVDAVLDGDLDRFVEAYLRWSHGKEGKKNG
ncbi:MAG TPA: peptide chain release factor 2 [bacterium]|nr:peptide chain release factor 2 [bacterium]